MKGTLSILGLLIIICVGCTCKPQRDEPTDEQLWVLFATNKIELEALRQMFEDDARQYGLRSVSATEAGGAECDSVAQTCLSPARLLQYGTLLKSTRLISVGRQETRAVYFLAYHNSTWTECFRHRGLVYDPGGSTVVHAFDDVEQRVDLGRGWFVYLIIDT